MAMNMNKKNKSTHNPSFSLAAFAVITIVYIIYDYLNTIKSAPTQLKITIAYLAFIIVIEFIINSYLTKSICGDYQISTSLPATFIPWVVIFGTMILLLTALPGWLSPFSNTFGYAAALMNGLDDTVNAILKDDGGESNAELSKAITHIYTDKSLLINEITPDNFNRFWTSMKSAFKPSALTDDSLKAKLFSIVVLKHSVAKFIWYILVGILTAYVSFNYIITSSCDARSTQANRQMDDYANQLAKKQAAETTKRKYVMNT